MLRLVEANQGVGNEPFHDTDADENHRTAGAGGHRSTAVAMASTGVASAQTKEIAVMLPAAGDPYFKLKACGYTEAGKEAGYDVKIYDAGGYGNLSRQVSQIQDVIQRKVSGIVLVRRVRTEQFRSSSKRSTPASR